MKTVEFKNYEEAKEHMKFHEICGIPFYRTNCLNIYTKAELEDVKKDKEKKEKFRGINIQSDLPEYISPITGKPVDGRRERREELKRSGCREVDPSEFKVEYTNQRFIEKHGIEQ